MSQADVDLIRSLIPPPDMDFAALFRDDDLFGQAVAALETIIDPDVEAVAVWLGGTTYVGIDGFRRMWLDWLEPWQTYYSRLDELVDVGDKVLALVRDRARRPDSDAEIELVSGSIWEVRDSKVVRVQFCGNRDEALSAAGLTELR
jgi:hypothetical protein